MKLVNSLLAGAVLAVSFSAFAADEMATPDDAKAMSEKAATLVNEKGDEAFATFQLKMAVSKRKTCMFSVWIWKA